MESLVYTTVRGNMVPRVGAESLGVNAGEDLPISLRQRPRRTRDLWWGSSCAIPAIVNDGKYLGYHYPPGGRHFLMEHGHYEIHI